MQNNIVKVGMVSLGCSKNQVDAERMLSLIKEGGFTLCADAGMCDVVIVNTCGFIEDAKKESIETILEFVQLKAEKKIKVVVVTGCLAQRYKEQLAQEIPEADVILGIGKNSEIVAAIKTALAGEQVINFGENTDLSLEGGRILANQPFFAYLKVAEGCDNCCSYCAIPQIRGAFRSRKMENIIAEAKELAGYGVTELNVVAQDTTRYGQDLYGKLMLPELLNALCEIDGIRWIRILYCYPERITDELINTIASQKKIVKYMDIPVQHVSKRILQLMNRPGDCDSLIALMQKIRSKIPNVVIRTTLITGFPTEDDADFEQLCDFVKQVQFERLGCFAYSQEEDTKAAELVQIEPELRKHRADIIMQMQMHIACDNNQQNVGKTLTVLCEGFDKEAECWFGRSYMDAPDIDTKVFFTTTTRVEVGQYVDVKITEVLDYDLVGRVV